jgi:ParB family chromosome partitioning protein
MTAPKIVSVAVDKIDPDPNQPRKSFPPDYIAQLARSIAKRGLIQPITLRPMKGGRYMIVAGECRWRAHVHNKAKTIKALVEELDDGEANLRAIVENVQRRDMNPIEEGRAFQTLIDRGYTVGGIREELGLTGTAYIQNRLDLLDLTPDVQALVASGNLSIAMGWAIRLAPANQQSRVVADINSRRLRTVEQVRHFCQALRDAESMMFPKVDLPRGSHHDVAKLRRLEAKVEAIADMVAAGFKDGACVAAQRVAPDRVLIMADKLALIRKHVLQMEHELRRAAIVGEAQKGFAA